MTPYISNRARILSTGLLVASALAAGGCAVDSDNLETDTATAAVTTQAPPVTSHMTYLAGLPAAAGGESALAALFAGGTADYVPVGSGTGYPVLFHSVPELDWLASQLWGGKTFRAEPGQFHPNGDPVVRLDNKIIKTPAGAVLNLFDAYVTRSAIKDVAIGVNGKGETVAPPSGVLAPIPVSFLQDAVVIDDKPSVVLDYFDDKSLPVIRRILDEIREVDGANCPGLWIGRAHARRCTSLFCGEVPSVLVDAPSKPTFASNYEWGFWTYFLLNFGGHDGQCDLGPAIARVQQQLGVALPPPPPATSSSAPTLQ